MLAEHGAQSGLGQLAGGIVIILHLDNCFFRINHPKIEDGIDQNRDIVPGNDILAGHIHGDHPQINPTPAEYQARQSAVPVF